MIIIRYKGGLGNQMFIYAMHMALAQNYPDVDILADTSRYLLHNEHNGYEIPSIWGLYPQEAESGDIKRISPYLMPTKWMVSAPKPIKDYICNNWQCRYYNSRLQEISVAKSYYKQEDHQVYDESVWRLDTSKDWYLDGLWQNTCYLKDVEDDIKKAFFLVRQTENGDISRFSNLYAEKDLEWIQLINESGDYSVSIHVRRGDFTGSKFDICGMEYYNRAIAELAERVGDGLSFFFFTDDVDYVQKQFADVKCKTIIHHDVTASILDMDMMSRCKHHIVSNSTFAWWSAWLGGRDGVTIAPKYSLRKGDKYYPLSVPPDWIQIEVQ